MSKITRATQYLYRLPSGALTAQQLSWDALVPTRLTPAEIAFALVGKLRSALPGEELSNLQFVLWQALPDDFGDAMQRATRSDHPVYKITDEYLNFRYGTFSPFRAGRRVALITDSLLTGRTASSLLNALRRMEAVPCAVLCVVDGRLDHGAPLSTFAGSVPVASCLSHRLVFETPGGSLDHVRYVEAHGGEERRDHSGDDKLAIRFHSWLVDDVEAGIYIGHVDRGRARHFTTYLNVGHVVTTHPEAVELLVETIAQRVKDFSDSKPPLRLVFPADESGFAAEIAAKASDGLTARLSCNVEKYPAVRDADGTWRCSAGPWSDNFTAVIIDWGAVTTATIRALMTVAAQKGAHCIHVVVLTSQLAAESEQSVTSIASIRARRDPLFTGTLQFEERTEEVAETVEVPVTVEFLSRVPLGMATSSECHLCQITQELRIHASEAPSRFLREHAERKYELYRPRFRREVLGRPAKDLVGLTLTSKAAATIWLNHQRLARARTSTALRAEIRSEILAWPPASRENGQSWLRLLVVESYWLKRPPLDGEDVRERIGSFCVQELLKSAESDSTRRGIRWQSAIVLRTASKRLLVERFGDLLLASADDETVAAELCYGMYTLQERPYNHHSSVMGKLLAALLDARDRLAERRSGEALSRTLLFTVSALYRRAVQIQTRVSGADNIFSAWHALQSNYVAAMSTHAGALTSILVVLNAFSGPAAERAAMSVDKPNETYWSEVGNAWSVCWDFLSQSVFPFLPVLRDALESSSLGSVAGGGVAFMEFNDQRAARLGNAIADLERKPNLFTSDRRRLYEQEAFAWFEALLRGPEGRYTAQSAATSQGCQLLRTVSQNPCDLRQAWHAALAMCQKAGSMPGKVLGDPPSNIGVFCRRPLLVDTFTHIIQNAVGSHHADPVPPEGGVTLSIDVTFPNGIIKVIVRNDGTIAGKARGGGLSFYATELATLGSRLEHDVPEDRPWTYEVRLNLRPWII